MTGHGSDRKRQEATKTSVGCATCPPDVGVASGALSDGTDPAMKLTRLRRARVTQTTASVTTPCRRCRRGGHTTRCRCRWHGRSLPPAIPVRVWSVRRQGGNAEQSAACGQEVVAPARRRVSSSSRIFVSQVLSGVAADDAASILHSETVSDETRLAWAARVCRRACRSA